jgi:hypothetical protein
VVRKIMLPETISPFTLTMIMMDGTRKVPTPAPTYQVARGRKEGAVFHEGIYKWITQPFLSAFNLKTPFAPRDSLMQW